MGLPTIEFLHQHEVLKIFVIGPDLEPVVRTFQKMLPPQCPHDRQHLLKIAAVRNQHPYVSVLGLGLVAKYGLPQLKKSLYRQEWVLHSGHRVSYMKDNDRIIT
jgi:hypothetical protein